MASFLDLRIAGCILPVELGRGAGLAALTFIDSLDSVEADDGINVILLISFSTLSNTFFSELSVTGE